MEGDMVYYHQNRFNSTREGTLFQWPLHSSTKSKHFGAIRTTISQRKPRKLSIRCVMTFLTIFSIAVLPRLSPYKACKLTATRECVFSTSDLRKDLLPLIKQGKWMWYIMEVTVLKTT